MPRKLAEAAVRMRRASARLDVPPPSTRRFASSNPLTSLLPDVILGELSLSSHASILMALKPDVLPGKQCRLAHEQVAFNKDAS